MKNLRMKKIKEFLPEIDEENIFLRAEDDWNNWKDFRHKSSVEYLYDWDDEEDMDFLIEESKKKSFQESYDVVYDECGEPIELTAKGVNSLLINSENFCSAVHYIKMIGYDDDEFIFVFFKGVPVGKNWRGDGWIVQPSVLLKISYPPNVFSICRDR